MIRSPFFIWFAKACAGFRFGAPARRWKSFNDLLGSRKTRFEGLHEIPAEAFREQPGMG